MLDIWKPSPDRKVIINIPTTVQIAMPHVFATQIEYIHKNLKYRDSVLISVHPHNDRAVSYTHLDVYKRQRQLIGLEIKSDADTYERLKRQIRDYNKYCDVNYVVVGKSHEKHVEEHIPSWWGIIVVEAEGKEMVINEKKAASENPKMKRELQITLLWRPELQKILALNHLPAYKQKSKKFVHQKLMEKLDWDRLKHQMCEEPVS